MAPVLRSGKQAQVDPTIVGTGGTRATKGRRRSATSASLRSYSKRRPCPLPACHGRVHARQSTYAKHVAIADAGSFAPTASSNSISSSSYHSDSDDSKNLDVYAAGSTALGPVAIRGLRPIRERVPELQLNQASSDHLRELSYFATRLEKMQLGIILCIKLLFFCYYSITIMLRDLFFHRHTITVTVLLLFCYCSVIVMLYEFLLFSYYCSVTVLSLLCYVNFFVMHLTF